MSQQMTLALSSLLIDHLVQMVSDLAHWPLLKLWRLRRFDSVLTQLCACAFKPSLKCKCCFTLNCGADQSNLISDLDLFFFFFY